MEYIHEIKKYFLILYLFTFFPLITKEKDTIQNRHSWYSPVNTRWKGEKYQAT